MSSIRRLTYERTETRSRRRGDCEVGTAQARVRASRECSAFLRVLFFIVKAQIHPLFCFLHRKSYATCVVLSERICWSFGGCLVEWAFNLLNEKENRSVRRRRLYRRPFGSGFVEARPNGDP